MVLNGMAEGFEVLPRTLADNCGFDASKLLAELSHIHYNAVIPNFERFIFIICYFSSLICLLTIII